MYNHTQYLLLDITMKSQISLALGVLVHQQIQIHYFGNVFTMKNTYSTTILPHKYS